MELTLAAVIRVIAGANASLGTLTILELSEAVVDAFTAPDLSTVEGRLAFARSIPEIQEAINAGKKIQAIKILRERSQGQANLGYDNNGNVRNYLSLVDSKNVVDAMPATECPHGLSVSQCQGRDNHYGEDRYDDPYRY